MVLKKVERDVEYFHFFILVYSQGLCPPGSFPPLFLTAQVVDVVVVSCLSGQFAACGPCPPPFAQVVVVVVVVSSSNPPFTGSSVVVVVVVTFGGLARAASGVAIIIAAPIANTTASKVILEFMCCMNT